MWLSYPQEVPGGAAVSLIFTSALVRCNSVCNSTLSVTSASKNKSRVWCFEDTRRVMVSGENLYDGRDGRPAAHLVIVWPHGVPVVDGMVAA